MDCKTIMYLLSPVFVTLILVGAIKFKARIIKRKKIDTEQRIVEYPLAILILGSLGSTLFAVEVINCYNEQSLFETLFFSFWSIVGIFLIVLQMNFRIYYDEEKIVYSGLLKKTRTYNAEDIIKISEKGNTVYIWFSDGRKIDFNFDYCTGSVDFYIFINNALRNNRKNIEGESKATRRTRRNRKK